ANTRPRWLRRSVVQRRARSPAGFSGRSLPTWSACLTIRACLFQMPRPSASSIGRPVTPASSTPWVRSGHDLEADPLPGDLDLGPANLMLRVAVFAYRSSSRWRFSHSRRYARQPSPLVPLLGDIAFRHGALIRSASEPRGADPRRDGRPACRDLRGDAAASPGDWLADDPPLRQCPRSA